MHRPTAALFAVAVSLSTLAACGSSGSDGSSATTQPAAAKTTTTAAAGPLQILVSNDDGYAAPGIDTVVETLRKLDDVEVTVVAPLENKSGTGGHATSGKLTTSKVETASGYPATAVDGFPADSVRYAIDDQGLEPDLVVAGNNLGQNLSPMVDISGTVGAARAGATRGVPAIAISQGVGDPVDYPAAMPLLLDWIKEHRAAIEAGTAEATVTNLNVPSCAAGKLRGLLELSSKPGEQIQGALAKQDCTSTTPEADLANDVEAFNNGFATIAVVPNEPAS